MHCPLNDIPHASCVPALLVSGADEAKFDALVPASRPRVEPAKALAETAFIRQQKTLPGSENASALVPAARSRKRRASPASSEEKPPQTKRRRASEPVSSTADASGNGQSSSDPLDPEVLTPKVWAELLDQFRLHYSSDLSFIHPPTFLKLVPPSESVTNPPAQGRGGRWKRESPHPAASPLFLFSFLALTARFHPDLVARNGQSTSGSSDPLVASEYYAVFARNLLKDGPGTPLERPSVEKTQALLMLGLHEWGMCHGVQAWLYVGAAVRFALALGLDHDPEPEHRSSVLTPALKKEAKHLGLRSLLRDPPPLDLSRSNSAVDREVRRRTLWSCFVLDRYLSGGKSRLQTLRVADLTVRLPSSTRAFLFGNSAPTKLLRDVVQESSDEPPRTHVESIETGDRDRNRRALPNGPNTTQPQDKPRPTLETEPGAQEADLEECDLGRVIRIVEIWGRVAKWSCSGGRRTEKYPPWDSRTTFFYLRNLLSTFYADLPFSMASTPANLSAYILSRAPTPYVLMHTLYNLCQIVLHREYVPFLPLRCAKPEGPLDEPTFPADKYQIPPGWWDDSAWECFKAARNTVDILQPCQEWGVLVETPIVGFAIYTVAFTGIYCQFFPQMDPNGFMSHGGKAKHDGSGPRASKTAVALLLHMKKRLKMANGWCRTINKVQSYIRSIKRDYDRNTRIRAGSSSERDLSPTASQRLSLREGGAGGGLEEYKLLEESLKDFGTIRDDDTHSIEPDTRIMDTVDEDDASDAGTEVMESGVEVETEASREHENKSAAKTTATTYEFDMSADCHSPVELDTPRSPRDTRNRSSISGNQLRLHEMGQSYDRASSTSGHYSDAYHPHAARPAHRSSDPPSLLTSFTSVDTLTSADTPLEPAPPPQLHLHQESLARYSSLGGAQTGISPGYGPYGDLSTQLYPTVADAPAREPWFDDYGTGIGVDIGVNIGVGIGVAHDEYDTAHFDGPVGWNFDPWDHENDSPDALPK
ncbi:MAG: hypothetical protein M1838_002554 [Thelocarpon superellum]|nr:MAG: hypothetical protein M1838_002554 [Thelocarpon superellum]